MRTRAMFFLTAAAAAVLAAIGLPARAQQQETISFDAKAPTTPFPHFWEQTFGSGRAILALRDSYRQDLLTVKQATNFRSVRFHGIFMDEVGIYDPDRMTKNPGLAAEAADDASIYNFSYLDQIYDTLMVDGIRPFVELSFMPRKLAKNPEQIHSFWYHPIVSPPKDYGKWDAMIRAFAQHLIDRYGIDEVSMWKFEVWNEPNLDFWAGEPKQATYFEFYDHTSRALKSVSPRLQVGGPATAQAAWITPFLAHAKEASVPVDFVTTHAYANDTAENIFGTNEVIDRDKMVWRAVKKAHEEILASPYPTLPLIFSEYNASYSNEPNVTDSTFIGPWLANTIRLCDGMAENMAYWTFSDVFEEQGVPRTPFYGGFGLIAQDNIPKPALNAFRALHKLGDRRIKLDSESAIATTSKNSLAIALWNYAPPVGTGAKYTMPEVKPPSTRVFHLEIKNSPYHEGELWRVDDEHGNVLKSFDAMGRPISSLTKEQIATLQTAGAMAPAENVRLEHDKLDIAVPEHGLAVLVFEK